MPGAAGPVRVEAAVDATADDLDAEHSPGTAAGSGRPHRSRWTVVVGAALVVGIGVGAALVHQGRASAEVDAGLDARLASLQVVRVRPAAAAPDPPARDGRGRVLLPLWVTVGNDGETAAQVTAEGVSPAGTEVVGRRGRAELVAGARGVVRVDVAVDCAAALATATAPESWVELRVHLGSGARAASRAWRYDTVPQTTSSLPGIVAGACEPPATTP